MTPSAIAYRLKKIYRRKFREAEMSEYAVKLNLSTTNNNRGAALHYVWNESNYQELLKIIE